MGPLSNGLIRSVEKITGQPRIKQLYFDYISDDLPAKSWEDASPADIVIDLRSETDQLIENVIPAQGRLLAIANHPYGVIDGLILCAFDGPCAPRLPDHHASGSQAMAPAVMDKILPIDFDETAALANNLQTRAAAHQHLKNGGAVIIFPAGAISLAPNVVGKAIDTDWKTFAAKLAMTPDTTTLPFFRRSELAPLSNGSAD